MIQRPDLRAEIFQSWPSEYARFQNFLAGHDERLLAVDGLEIPYCVCGNGEQCLLTFAGGWGGIEILYETILDFEAAHRIIVVDITPFRDPESLCRGTDRVLDHVGTGRVTLMGQSLAGILAQLYLRHRAERVEAAVLTSTLVPRVERCRPWARLLLRCLPFPLLRPLIHRKMGRLSRTEREIPVDLLERRHFAAALMAARLTTCFTRERINRLLDLVWGFNTAGAYRPDEFATWPGRILIVSSEDDPSHADSRELAASLPGSELALLPTGYGHLAPQIYRDEYLETVRAFLDSL